MRMLAALLKQIQTLIAGADARSFQRQRQLGLRQLIQLDFHFLRTSVAKRRAPLQHAITKLSVAATTASVSFAIEKAVIVIVHFG